MVRRDLRAGEWLVPAHEVGCKKERERKKKRERMNEKLGSGPFLPAEPFLRNLRAHLIN